MIGVDRVGGQGGSALTIQISQAGWTDVIYLSIYLSATTHHNLMLSSCLI